MKINQITFDHTVDPSAPPVQQGTLALAGSIYSGNENTIIPFTIFREDYLNERVSVDWAITNANVTPSSGTVIFEIGDDQKTVSPLAGEVGPTEVGTLTISKAVNLSGGQPPIIDPFRDMATYTVVDTNPPDVDIIVAASGGDYTNFNAAIAAAVPGDVIEGRADILGGVFEDAIPVTAANSGSVGNRIVVRGRSGDTIKITGAAGSGNSSYNVRLDGNFIDFGENILCEGDALPNQSNASRGIYVTGNNNIVRASATKSNIHSVWVNGGTNTVIVDGYHYIVGTLDTGAGSDGGDGIESQTAGSTPTTVFKRVGVCGGHGVMGMQNARGVRAQYIRGENLWDQEDDRLHPGVTTDGNRVHTWAEGFQDGVLRDFVYGPSGQPYDTTETQVMRISGQDILSLNGLIIGNRNNGAGINTNVPPNDPRPTNLYFAHLTITDNDGSGYGLSGGGVTDPAHVPQNINFLNCLFWNNAFNGNGNAQQSAALFIEYSGGAPGSGFHPSDFITMRGCAVPSGTVFRFRIRGGSNTDYTLAQLEANWPASFNNNFVITDPMFIDATIPRVARPVSEFDMTMITTPYANFEPQNASLIGVGLQATRANGAVSASPSVTVDDAGWFHEPDFSGLVLGSDVYIEGHGLASVASKAGNNLTMDQNITCADNARIFLGKSAAPNIGWWQGAGFYS